MWNGARAGARRPFLQKLPEWAQFFLEERWDSACLDLKHQISFIFSSIKHVWSLQRILLFQEPFMNQRFWAARFGPLAPVWWWEMMFSLNCLLRTGTGWASYNWAARSSHMDSRSPRGPRNYRSEKTPPAMWGDKFI